MVLLSRAERGKRLAGALPAARETAGSCGVATLTGVADTRCLSAPPRRYR
ncbi:hypothetical protein ACGFZQ_44245 [Streptomyces sp. NPDC048254]